MKRSGLQATDLPILARRRRLSASEHLALVALFRSQPRAVRQAMIQARVVAAVFTVPTLDPVVAALRRVLGGNHRHLAGRHRQAAMQMGDDPACFPRLILEEARVLVLESGRFAPIVTAEALIKELETSDLVPLEVVTELLTTELLTTELLATELHQRVAIYGADLVGISRRPGDAVTDWIGSTLEYRDEVSADMQCDLLAMAFEAYARAAIRAQNFDVARSHLSHAEALQEEDVTPPDCLAQLELEMAIALNLAGRPVEATGCYRSALERMESLPDEVNEPLRMRLHFGYGEAELDHVMGGLWNALSTVHDLEAERNAAVEAWRKRTRVVRHRARRHLEAALPLLEQHGAPTLCALHEAMLGRALMWQDSQRGVDLLVAATRSLAALGESETEHRVGRELFGWLLILDRWCWASEVAERLDAGLLERLKQEGLTENKPAYVVQEQADA